MYTYYVTGPLQSVYIISVINNFYLHVRLLTYYYHLDILGGGDRTMAWRFEHSPWYPVKGFEISTIDQRPTSSTSYIIQ